MRLRIEILQAYSRLAVESSVVLVPCDGESDGVGGGGGVAGTTGYGGTGPKRECNAPLVFMFSD